MISRKEIAREVEKSRNRQHRVAQTAEDKETKLYLKRQGSKGVKNASTVEQVKYVVSII